MRSFLLVLTFIFLIFVSIVGCTNPSEGVNSQEHCGDIDCGNSTLITVFAEDSLPESRKLALMAAFDQWSEKTESCVRFDVAFVPVAKLKYTINIKNTFFVFYRAPANKDFEGYTTWNVSAGGAAIELSPKIAEEYFEPVSMHEIGHALWLEHYEGKEDSIMQPAMLNGNEITCIDLESFNKLHPQCHKLCN